MATVVTNALPVAAKAGRTPLGLWHLLSLDAPSVAALWTVFLSRVFGVGISPIIPVALGLAVWVLYAADRVQDAVRGGVLEERHWFHLRHQQLFVAAILFAIPVVLALLPRLPGELRTAWLLLSLPLLLYLFMIHGLHMPRMPKEAIVAIFFGTATALPSVVTGNAPFQSMWPSILLFAALCWFNGIAIARWEPQAHRTANACTVWLARHLSRTGWLLASACVVQIVMRAYRPVALTVLFSTGLLVLLDKERGRLQSVHVRALADAALLTPLVVWPFLSSLTGR